MLLIDSVSLPVEARVRDYSTVETTRAEYSISNVTKVSIPYRRENTREPDLSIAQFKPLHRRHAAQTICCHRASAIA